MFECLTGKTMDYVKHNKFPTKVASRQGELCIYLWHVFSDASEHLVLN